VESVKMVILGIDPGYGKIGYGVIEKLGNNYNTIDYGVIYTNKDLQLSSRLLKIKDELKNLIKQYKPDEAAVEELFFFKNVATAIQVGEARGVILLTLEEENIPIYMNIHHTKLNKQLLVMDTQKKVRFKEL
jgi:crossover junction endodeoxyribonuclease RuvC